MTDHEHMPEKEKRQIDSTRERAHAAAAREPRSAFWACAECGSLLTVVASRADGRTLVRTCRACEERSRPGGLRRWSRRLRR